MSKRFFLLLFALVAFLPLTHAVHHPITVTFTVSQNGQSPNYNVIASFYINGVLNTKALNALQVNQTVNLTDGSGNVIGTVKLVNNSGSVQVQFTPHA